MDFTTTLISLMDTVITGDSDSTSHNLQTLVNETAVIEPIPDPLPMYIRITVFICIIVILGVGIIGNSMVTMVISCSRDMRTSTNYFLVNLSVADLLVLILVTPTALLEVIYHPEIWLLGEAMCYVVPTLEMTVCHASVLTILAISFERYYAICSPLKANYVCTRGRAAVICAIIWIVACFITSPMFFMTFHLSVLNENGVAEPKCIVGAGEFWPDTYALTSILLFFLLPLGILLIIYGIIARKLGQDRSALNAKNENQRGRRQVVLMLGCVVFSFFLCLLPFRLLTLVVLLSDYGELLQRHTHTYYTLLYFTRIMTYVNSALNPILYNIMSSKFRNGFLRLCGRRPKQYIFHRNGTFLTLTTTASHILNNNAPSTHVLATTPYTTSPSTSPELILSTSLVRKNGVMVRKLVPDGPAPLYKYSGRQGAGKRIQSSFENNKTLINPKTLNKNFIYSYVSGRRSESML